MLWVLFQLDPAVSRESRREQCPSWTVQYWTATQKNLHFPTVERLGWGSARLGLNLCQISISTREQRQEISQIPSLAFSACACVFPTRGPQELPVQLSPAGHSIPCRNMCHWCQWSCSQRQLCQVEENLGAGVLQAHLFLSYQGLKFSFGLMALECCGSRERFAVQGAWKCPHNRSLR